MSAALELWDRVLEYVTAEWQSANEIAFDAGLSSSQVYRILRGWAQRGEVELQLGGVEGHGKTWLVRRKVAA